MGQLEIWWWKKGVFSRKKNWLENLLMVSRLTQTSYLGNAHKNMDFLVALLQKFKISLFFITSNHKRCQTMLKFKETISVLLKTMKLKSITTINKFLGLSIIFQKIEKQIRNLNTQHMIS